MKFSNRSSILKLFPAAQSMEILKSFSRKLIPGFSGNVKMQKNLLKTLQKKSNLLEDKEMTALQIAYLDSLTLNATPETEEELIDQAYARLLYLIDNDEAESISDAQEYLFFDHQEEEL